MNDNTKLLEFLTAGGSKIESSRWSGLWIEMIESNMPEQEATKIFESIRRLSEKYQDGNTWKVRASEGRRAYVYGRENKAHALEILRNNSYHKAIALIPPIHQRHSIPEPRELKNQLLNLIEHLSVDELKQLLLAANKLHSERRR